MLNVNVSIKCRNESVGYSRNEGRILVLCISVLLLY